MSGFEHKPDQETNWEPRSLAGYSPHTLRRYLAGELSPDERQAIHLARENNSELASWLQEEEAADQAFRIEMPFRKFEEAHQQKQQSLSKNVFRMFVRRFSKWQIAAPSLAAGAAAVLFAINLSPLEGGPSSPAQTNSASPQISHTSSNRTKGGATLGVLVRGTQAVRQVFDGEELKAGDQIQFVSRWVPGYRSAVIGSIDGRGAVSIYVAETNASSLEQTQTQLAKQSIILDSSVGNERFFLLLSQGELEELRSVFHESASKLVESNADLSIVNTLPVGDAPMTQSSILIKKVP